MEQLGLLCTQSIQSFGFMNDCMQLILPQLSRQSGLQAQSVNGIVVRTLLPRSFILFLLLVKASALPLDPSLISMPFPSPEAMRFRSEAAEMGSSSRRQSSIHWQLPWRVLYFEHSVSYCCRTFLLPIGSSLLFSEHQYGQQHSEGDTFSIGQFPDEKLQHLLCPVLF